MKRVVGLLGSPRKAGNTDILLDRALEGARSAGAAIEKIALNDLDFRPCRECGGCDRTGVCVVDDDMRLVYEAVGRSGGIAVASPVFFGNVSAQLKMMIDRFQCRWVDKYVLKNRSPRRKKRRGIFLCVSSADKADFFENSTKVVRNFFASIDAECVGELFCPGCDEKGRILKNEEVLEKAFRLGLELVKD